ncbi:bifunctional riboflavin kinase/FAD synthetase [Wenzhouxiangella sp. XN79A]|uniref:bifunctional riboflavin kinase/FAD synthetase n=1 Tax=Wenzhouxiangella sp. XN79A TaxID=2724193 RepID=UPI00144A60F4|nr:bifunctional riboflavin kinase/FAD synthetase [Wenzhouxiangella sp. XN79A]NKI34683.1 bifunctional riboflavin kinase/FAD synthetase [Wenzhouxiangella sp. XN79A]
MHLLRRLPLRDDDARPTALAIGNFDGLHRGHQALVERVVARAPALRPGLMCFEPLPRSFFAPDRPVPRLMKLRDRVRIGAGLGLELIAALRFDRAFSSLSPEAFARDVVAGGIRARHVVVGEDFRFGQRAAGDVDALVGFGRRYGFEVEAVPAVVDPVSGERISSSALRAALADGDLAGAERLLGRPYSISGRVLRGNRIGRTLGFPTVNLRVAEPPALSGICAVRVHADDLEGQSGVASLGQRPVVAGRDWLLEVHLFDIERDLYGRHLVVEFVEYIRPERHFDDLAAMTVQMHADAEAAKRALGGLRHQRQ